MPRFGAPAGQRRADRERQIYINTFKEPKTLTRFLWEDPELTWYEYAEHYHHGGGPNGKGLSYPCVSRIPDLGPCVGCTWTVENEFAIDEEDRDKDFGWSIRKIGMKYVVPTLAKVEGYLTLRKVSGRFRDRMAKQYEGRGSITNQDCTIIRDGEGFDTTFEPVWVEGSVAERKHTRELRELFAQLEEGMRAPAGSPAYDQAWAAWYQGNRDLGMPDLDVLLGDRYNQAHEFYDLDPVELERRASVLAAAQESPDGPVVGAKAQHSPQASYETASPSELTELGQLAADLNAWGVPYPMDATLEEMRTMHTTFGRGRTAVGQTQTPEEKAAAEAAEALEAIPRAPGYVEPKAPAEAAQEAPAQVVPADGVPPFREWDTPDVKDWLTTNGIMWTATMPRSQLVKLAEAATGQSS